MVFFKIRINLLPNIIQFTWFLFLSDKYKNAINKYLQISQDKIENIHILSKLIFYWNIKIILKKF